MEKIWADKSIDKILEQRIADTRCVCETQMPPIMANSNNGQDHKDKYFDTSRNILSQEMTICNMEALIFYFLESRTNIIFF